MRVGTRIAVDTRGASIQGSDGKLARQFARANCSGCRIGGPYTVSTAGSLSVAVEAEIRAHCSWCFHKTRHKHVGKNTLGRAGFEYGKCFQRTLVCVAPKGEE